MDFFFGELMMAKKFIFVLVCILASTVGCSHGLSRSSIKSQSGNVGTQRVVASKTTTEAKEARRDFDLILKSLDKIEGKAGVKGETGLYFSIVEYFKKGNETQLNRTLRKLLNKYPHSAYADNALYLSGQLALKNLDYTSALQQFNRIMYQYPNSNKAISALYSKGLVYKSMNLHPEAARVFSRVKAKYPGSAEATQAERALQGMYNNSTRM
jgi:TolA-binding protein